MSFCDLVRHHFLNFIRVDVRWLVVCRQDTPIMGPNREEYGHFRYVLYESVYGVRKYEAISSTPGMNLSVSFEDDKFYTDIILPWKKGIRTSGVDTYEQAKQQQAVDILAGK